MLPPLEVGLASEARSTTGRWPSRENEDEPLTPCDAHDTPQT
jgi:hypothetical protein